MKAKAAKHGMATLVLDSEGKFHTLAGWSEIIGVYDEKVEAAQLLRDLGLEKELIPNKTVGVSP